MADGQGISQKPKPQKKPKTKQILLIKFQDSTAGIDASFWTHKRMHRFMIGQTVMEVEKVYQI